MRPVLETCRNIIFDTALQTNKENSMEELMFHLNGKHTPFKPGQTILEAAAAVGNAFSPVRRTLC